MFKTLIKRIKLLEDRIYSLEYDVKKSQKAERLSSEKERISKIKVAGISGNFGMSKLKFLGEIVVSKGELVCYVETNDNSFLAESYRIVEYVELK